MFFNDGNGQYSYLSPFSKHPITENGVKFQSVYHYYTYNKFNPTDPRWAATAVDTKTTKTLLQIGNSRRHQITPNWDSKKYDVMKRGYELKFQQHKGTKQGLINLNASALQYNAQPTFKYWSCYGQNMLGRLLLELKKKYTEESAPKHKPVIVKKVVTSIASVSVKARDVDLKEVRKFADMLYQVPVPVLPPSLAGTGVLKLPPVADDEKEVLVDTGFIKRSKSDNEVDEITTVPVPILEMSLQNTQTVSVNLEPKPDMEEKREELKMNVQQKELLIISLDILDNNVENSICIPLAEKKLITNEEVDDYTLIKISQKLNELNVTKNICLNDTAGWYSCVLQNLSRAIDGKSVDLKSPAGEYAQGIMERHPSIAM